MSTKYYGEKPEARFYAMDPDDHPENDKSELLNDEGVGKFQYSIWGIQWTMALGRIDLSYVQIYLSSVRVPRSMGFLQGLCKIYGFLCKYPGEAIWFQTGIPRDEVLLSAMLIGQVLVMEILMKSYLRTCQSRRSSLCG